MINEVNKLETHSDAEDLEEKAAKADFMAYKTVPLKVRRIQVQQVWVGRASSTPWQIPPTKV